MDERGGYYATIPAPVLDDPSLGYASMVLYAKIVNYSRKNGFCYAKNAQLLRDMERVDPATGAVSSVTERTLQGWLAELKAAGHIQIDTGPCPPDECGHQRTGRRIFIGGNAAQMGEKIFGGENNFAEGVKNFSPQPIKCKNNNIKNNNPLPPNAPRELRKEIDAYAGDDEELRQALLAFAEQREKRRKAMKTARQLHLLTGKLDRFSGGDRAEKIRLLDEATEHGWDSVYQHERDRAPAAAEPRPAARRYVRTDIVDGREVDVYE